MSNPPSGPIPPNTDFFEVQTPAGATFTVIGDAERDYYEGLAARYQKDHVFGTVSDLQDLDRLLAMEVMAWRWQMWLSQEVDYWGGIPDIDALRKSLKECSQELRLLKKSMGIDKATREKDKGSSIAEYIENLKVRAKQFGVVREDQLTKALTLFHELSALCTLYNNTTPSERKEQNCEMTDIWEWIEKKAIPQFHEIDAYFREHTQKYWRDL